MHFYSIIKIWNNAKTLRSRDFETSDYFFPKKKLTYSRFYPEINFHGRFAHKNAELIRSWTLPRWRSRNFNNWSKILPINFDNFAKIIPFFFCTEDILKTCGLYLTHDSPTLGVILMKDDFSARKCVTCYSGVNWILKG